VRKADNLPLYCAVVTKSGNFNFLEPSGPVQACNGTALPLPLYIYVCVYIHMCIYVCIHIYEFGDRKQEATMENMWKKIGIQKLIEERSESLEE